MTQVLKQSTAVDVLIGPFVDISDGATAETGESPSVKLSKNGQALAAKNDATTPVHDADGYYNCELDATDTNTVGTLILTVAASATALPVRHEFQVVEEAIYDAIYAASAAGFDANGRVDVGSWIGTAVTLGNGAPDVNIQSTDDIDLSATQKASVNAEADTALTDYDAVVPADLPTNFADLDITVTTGEVNVGKIHGSSNAAARLEDSAEVIRFGTASGTPSTTSMVSNVSVTVDDQFNGRIIVFKEDTTTAALRGQATDITGCTASSNTLTFTALTNAPVSGDTFVIL